MNEKVSKKKRKSIIFKSRPKLHLCTFPNCGKRFPSTCHLEIHNRIHTGEKPYKCRVCFKRFSQSGTLIIHERTHTGDKPYQCKVCLQRFTQTGSLNNHERIHTVGQATFKCPYCRKTIYSHRITNHMKTIHGMSNVQIDLLRRQRALKRKKVSKVGKEAPAPIKVKGALKPSNNTILACLECPKRDTDLASLKNHMKDAHGLELGANFDKTLLLLEWPQFINSTIIYLE